MTTVMIWFVLTVNMQAITSGSAEFTNMESCLDALRVIHNRLPNEHKSLDGYNNTRLTSFCVYKTKQ